MNAMYHPNHRLRAGDREDRPGQPDLQHDALHPAQQGNPWRILGISAPKRPLLGAFQLKISQRTVFSRIEYVLAGIPGRNDISKLS